ncbi:MAG: hypothetical protein QXZ41_05365 [Ignisphaera sp.]
MSTYELIAIITLFVFGYLAQRTNIKGIRRVFNILNKFLIYSIAPLTIFVGVYGQASHVILALVGLCVVHTILIMVLTFGFSILASRHRNELGLLYAMVISMGIPNSGFLAIPLAVIVFGTYFNIIPYTVAANIILPFVLLFIATSLKFEKKSLIISTTPIPSLAALVLAVSFKFLEIVVPQNIISIANTIINSVSFIFFLILGYTLALLSIRDFRTYMKWIVLGYTIKYVFSPMLMHILLMLTTNLNSNVLDLQYTRGLLMQSFMPSALFNIVIGNIFKLEAKLISILLVLQTLTSIVITIVLFSLLL